MFMVNPLSLRDYGLYAANGGGQLVTTPAAASTPSLVANDLRIRTVTEKNVSSDRNDLRIRTQAEKEEV
jgi:hypothetical protein